MAKIADVIVLSTPYDAAPAAVQAAGDLSGKLLWTIINPFKEDFSGLKVGLTTSGPKSSQTYPSRPICLGSTILCGRIASKKLQIPAPLVFVWGDDAEARAIVLTLIEDLGFDGIDADALFAARFFEPAMMGIIYLAYGQTMGNSIGFRLLRTDTAGATGK